MNKNLHLNNVLDSYHINKEEDLKLKYMSKRDEVKEALESHFSGKIYSPINSGSYAKHTIINTKFDFDLAVPFKHDSYTLEEMYNAVYDFFNGDDFKDDTLRYGFPRKQKVSIGLEFTDGDDIISIDVVPGREIGEVGNYLKDNDINLCINEAPWGKVSHIKTNIQSHIDLIKGNNVEREVIKLLKVWKTVNNIDIKSFLIELITIKAFEDNMVELTGLWEKLEMVMEYIKDNIETIKLADPANGNGNVVSDTLEDYEKANIKDAITSYLDNIENDDEKLKTYFPENPDHPSEDEEEAKYGVGVGASQLNNNDFG